MKTAIKRDNYFTRVFKTSLLASCIAAAPAYSQGLEEIVVTAQLREENIQDVPVAVTAVSGTFLEDNSIKDVQELMWSVPSLVVGTNQSSGTGNFSIRGIGTGAQNFGLESSVGLYIDGVYRARQASMFNQLADLEAVEVLRGPQGTFFGKNSASGALLVRTVAPSHEQNAFLELTAGNYSMVNLNGAFNWSLSDTVAARTTFFSSERDGWIDVENLGSELNDRSRWGIRQQFLFEPSEDLSARLIVDYSEIDEVCCAALTLKDSLVASGRTNNGAPVFGTDAILTALGGTIYPTGSFDNGRTSQNVLPSSENEDSGVSLQINKRFDNFDFVSITAFRRFDIRDAIDADFSNVDLANRLQDADQTMWTQEFRITSDQQNRLRYQAGVYFYQQELESEDYLILGNLLPNYVTAASPDVLGALMGTPPQLLGFINLVYGQSFGPSFAPPVVPGNTIQDFSDQDHRANAIFGRIDYDLSDNLELNIGLRYTDESKDMNSRFAESVFTPGIADVNVAAIGAALGIAGEQAKAAVGAPPGDGTGNTFNPAIAGLNPAPFLPALNVLYVPGWANCSVTVRFCPRPDINASLDDSALTGNIGLSWRVDDTSLIYFAYGTGYKSGGTNTDRIGLGFDTVFDSEDTTNIEFGIKKDFVDNNLRINLAFYDMEVDDLQTNTFTGTAFNLQNAGRVDVQGVEAEVWWNPTDSLSFQLAYTYTDAKFQDFEKGNCQISNVFHTGDPAEAAQLLTQGYCNRSGDQVGNVSDNFLSLNATKTFDIGNGNTFLLGGEYVSYSDQIMNNTNDPFARQGDTDFLNVRAIARLNSGFEVMLWGRNLTDEGWYGTAFDTPLQDGKQSAYPREPRTYGLTLRKVF
ncbi:MAG: TonB-dependent receptor [Gammaproteobacteria bacterium]|nr:TonB-dependent receptor [Gammaproteobacteria bacterium]